MRVRLIAIGLLLLFVSAAPAREPEGKVLLETWQVSRTESGRLGQVHLIAREVEREGKKLIHTTLIEEISYIRSGDPYYEKQEQETLETPTGEVVEVGYVSTLAKHQKLWIRGRVVGEQMHLEVIGADGKPTRFARKIPWEKSALGLYAQEKVLEGRKLSAGERITFHTFNLTLNRVISTTFTIHAKAKTLVDGKERELWRVVQSYPKGLYMSESTHWVDEQGRIVKTELDMPLFGTAMIYELASKDAAAEKFKPKVADVEAPTTIDRPIPMRRGAPQELVLRVSMTGEDDPGTLFSRDGRQIVLKADKQAVELRLLARSPRDPVETALLAVAWTAGVHGGLPGSPEAVTMPLLRLAVVRVPRVDPEYLQSNFFIRSDDPQVQKLAKQAVGDETDPRKQLVQIRRWFRFRFKPGYDVAFATADEVARTLEGDCSEMGVLSCAMCRTLGIPSRIAFGVVYDHANPGFGGHLWTEVYVDGRWEPFDPTGVLDTLGAAYLKVAHFSMKDVINPDEILEVRRAFAGRMKVELLEPK